LLGPLAGVVASAASSHVRDVTKANARALFGAGVSSKRVASYRNGVIRNFYDFVVDVAEASRKTPQELDSSIVETVGEKEYALARKTRRGAVLLTAHIGSFEVGLARLAKVERVVQVVFKRDIAQSFEGSRRSLREALGIVESPIDDGIDTWLELREALSRDEVVVMQGDRTMPGQRGEVVNLLHGKLRLPTGPYKLARLTGSSIIPVFTLRLGQGRFRIVLGEPIDPNAGVRDANGVDPAVLAFARTLESIVEKHPEQWLVLHRAFEYHR